MHLTLRHPPRFALGVIAAMMCLSAATAGAQEQQSAPPPASASVTPPETPSAGPSTSQSPAGSASSDKTSAALFGQGQNTVNKDRLLGVLPNFATVETEHEFGPLTVKDKFKLTADSMLDPVTFPFIGLEALIGQAQNSDPEYGQGMRGYGARYGTAYGDALFGTLMTTSAFPSMLHQDPRYFQLGSGSIMHRSLYSISRLFVTRNDDGSHGFNYSEIAGNLVAAGISNAYHPVQERTFSNTMSVWGTDIMWDGVSNVLKEFWPDIRRHFQKKKEPQG
jgi:hypothetical protein